MLKLIAFGPTSWVPSASPFCVNGLCRLRIDKTKYIRIFGGDFRKPSKKKFPVLVNGDRKVAQMLGPIACAPTKTKHNRWVTEGSARMSGPGRAKGAIYPNE